MAFLAHDRNRGALLPIDAGGLPAKSGRPAADGRRWSGWGGSIGLVATERGAHQKACSRRRGSATGERRREAGARVTSRVQAAGEEVLDGALLGQGSRRPERGRSGLSAVAQ
jgi:hypothetical protein